MRNHPPQAETTGPAGAEAAIRRFLKSAREPALLEPGEDHFALADDSYALEWRGSRLTIQAWDRTRNLARRIAGVREERPGKLELDIERFGGLKGRIFLLDLSRAACATERRKGARLVFREQFRRSLRRQFPDWRIAELSTECNLEESLSPAYPRALLRRGRCGWAAIAAPPEPGAAASVLTFGLIWLDYLRRREHGLAVEGLALLLPQADARAVCLRLPFLDPDAARFTAFVYTPEGYEDQLDPADYGNLDTKLETCRSPLANGAGAADEWTQPLVELPFVEQVPRNDGSLSLRVRGLEFARVTGSELLFGLERKTAASGSNLKEAVELAREIARMRSHTAADRDHPICRSQPEAWLESQVRAHLEQIEPALHSEPVYGQVPAAAGGDRGIIDLLAADRAGRLTVIELKASEDIHLPLQALDYWMRVRWHAERDEFSRKGYFPGIALRRDWPRLLLVAPSLSFHPKTETVLRYFAPGIEVERIGLGVEWRQRPHVMFRAHGARRPLVEDHAQPDLR